MDETPKRNIARLLQVLVPIVGVSVTLISFLLTVASRKKELTCTRTASTRLVSENLGGLHPDLHVEFHGQPIGSLTKESFSLKNSGAAAIKGTDVLEPVRLQFPAGTRLLSATVERTYPPGFNFVATAIPESNTVTLSFTLLNSGDEAQFSVYSLNSEVQKPVFLGRVVDVTQMSFADSSISASAPTLPFLRSHATRSIFRWTLFLLYGLLAGIFVGLWIALVVSYLKYLPWKRKWGDAYGKLVEELREKEREKFESAKATLASDADERAVLEKELLVSEMIRHRAFPIYPVAISKELREKGIPPHPDPVVESLGGLAGLSLLLLTLAFVSTLTSLLAYGSLRG